MIDDFQASLIVEARLSERFEVKVFGGNHSDRAKRTQKGKGSIW